MNIIIIININVFVILILSPYFSNIIGNKFKIVSMGFIFSISDYISILSISSTETSPESTVYDVICPSFYEIDYIIRGF